MTWTKTGTEFPEECARDNLSDAAYRTHHEAVTWVSSVEQMSLRIPKRIVRRFAGSPDYQQACKELVELGYWRDHAADGEYQIVHHADTIRQSIGAQQAQRENAKQRQRKHRKKRDVTRDTPRDITRDVTGGVTENPDCLTSTSLSEAREVPARANGERAHRRDADLTPARTYLDEP